MNDPVKVVTAIVETPELSEYIQLMKTRPELFTNTGPIRIETDLNVIHSYMEKTGKKIGVMFHSNYHMLLVDLVQEQGVRFTYERLVPVTSCGAVVIVPIFNHDFILLRQFRHALRGEQIAFPRGYGEVGISSADNARKEIREEIGSEVKSITSLGTIVADSGLSGNAVSVYAAEITEPNRCCHSEGIQEIIALPESQLKQWIVEHRISDGFTLAAYCLFHNQSPTRSGCQ